MAEWSKALHLSCSLVRGVGSNPTSVIFEFQPAKNDVNKNLNIIEIRI